MNRLIEIAAKGYVDELILEYWDPKTARAVDTDAGDTLALFLARELRDVCIGEPTLLRMLATAEIAVSGAAYELQELAEHLAEAARDEEVRTKKGGPPST
ncbi:MAG TPA: hypothetical protein P5204_00090 [Kiritimatiellia bacterium]|nr:hypothetical protein [Kiritimatiellia bacterium]